ncbi:MAG: GGDEF domain-containing protein [Erysipelotrichaceae bacterium]|nr:GGDEF domain-containing protein [Erysipelotrichaceae bacterium]
MLKNEIIVKSLNKNYKVFNGFLLMVFILEIFMIIYGLITFDFSDERRVIYMFSYIALAIFSCISYFINTYSMKKNTWKQINYYNVIIYSFIIIFWSALISALDIVGGGFVVTYMTILAAIGSLIAFRPLAFIMLTVFSTVFMIVFVKLYGNIELGMPFYINHCIFLLVAITVELRNYHSIKNQLSLNEQLENQANIDSLTNIYNRRYLDNYINKIIDNKESFVFSLLDVDNFKMVNDKYGHQEGDTALKNIAKTLSSLFSNQVFRYGGDEFAIISFDSVESVIERLNIANQILMKNNKEVNLQLSAGIYVNNKTMPANYVYDFADKALYFAKESGKGCFYIYKQ